MAKVTFFTSGLACLAAGMMAFTSPAHAEGSFTPLLPQTTTTSLDNGLLVVVAPNPRTTHVAVAVMHRFGTADEPRRGTSFLLQRLTAAVGTKNMPAAVLQRAEREDGVRSSTWLHHDYAVSVTSGPTTHLGRVVWQASEPMASLFDGMTSAQYESARASAVKDLRQKAANREVLEEMHARVFPPGHPYHRGASAPDEEIATLSMEDARRIHRACIVPNNTTVVVTGNVDTSRAEELVRRYFGPIPPSNVKDPCRKHAAQNLPPPQPAKLSFESGTKQPFVAFEWATAHSGDADDFALDAAALALQERLDDRLVDNLKIAVRVGAKQTSYRLQSSFWVYADVAAGRTTAEVQRALEDEMTRVLRDGFSNDEIVAARRRLLATLVDAGDTTNTAYALASAAASPLGIGLRPRAAEAYASLDAARVTAAARRWLTPARRVDGVVETRQGAPVEGRLVGGKR